MVRINPLRQPKGIPVGGQFAGKSNPESDVDISDSDQDERRERERFNLQDLVNSRGAALSNQGFIPFTTSPNVTHPRSTDQRAAWWHQHMVTAEYGNQAGYAQMPDNWTPSRQSGHSIDGFRRTHRMAYVGGNVSLRMPSVTSVRSFASADFPGKPPGATFDVPVSADFPGGEVSGWVRVARGADGVWATQGLGFTHQQAAYVAESVQCVLEARHPTMALRQAGDILERRRQRAAQLGTKAERVRSSWIKAVGYDAATGTMVVAAGETADHERVYGYSVPEPVFQTIKSSPAPGKLYNRYVRGQAPRVEVTACEKCGRFSASPAGHRCPPTLSPRSNYLPRNALVRTYVFGRADSRPSA